MSNKYELERIVESIENAKMELIHALQKMEDTVPLTYTKKMDTIISKLEILEGQLENRSYK